MHRYRASSAGSMVGAGPRPVGAAAGRCYVLQLYEVLLPVPSSVGSIPAFRSSLITCALRSVRVPWKCFVPRRSLVSHVSPVAAISAWLGCSGYRIDRRQPSFTASASVA